MGKGLLLWQSGMAGAQVLAGASAITGVLGENYAGVFVVTVAALQASTLAYVHGLNTPVPEPAPKEIEP